MKLSHKHDVYFYSLIMVGQKELFFKFDEIYKKCSPILLHSVTNHDKILHKIIKIVRNSSREQLLFYHPGVIIQCLVKMIFHYDESLYHGKNCQWKRRRNLKNAKSCYLDLLNVYNPEKSDQVIQAVVDVIHQGRLWAFETFCFEILSDLLEYGSNGAILVDNIFNKVESMDKNSQDVRAIVKILYELLNVYNWPETQDTIRVIERSLKFFYKRVVKMKSSNMAFKNGLSICIKNMVKHLSNRHLLTVIYYMISWTVQDHMTDNIILNFGSILEYTAYKHQANLLQDTLTEKIFPLLMKMIASKSRIISLLGNRVMQYLIDREDNRMNFDTPKIFFENVHFDLKMKQCFKEDKVFLKLHREIIHDSLLKSIVDHSESRMNLEASYCTMCLIAIEIPCGFCAATLVCLVMNLQDYVLSNNKSHRDTDYHIHATAITIMSLVCWIHKAHIFFSYVNKIMLERAHWAPHMNPPIQSEYNFATHHILWNKPELFFVDWEVRYGLWKCFRLRNTSPKNAKENLDELVN